jgi:F-type H+-transporting ATPase subunit c
VDGVELLRLVAFVGAAISMGLGAIGPAIGTGIAGAEGVKAIGKREETRSVIVKVMLIGMAIAGSSGIYALVISVLLLYVVVGA